MKCQAWFSNLAKTFFDNTSELKGKLAKNLENLSLMCTNKSKH
jgi:hypothetical protein